MSGFTIRREMMSPTVAPTAIGMNRAYLALGDDAGWPPVTTARASQQAPAPAPSTELVAASRSLPLAPRWASAPSRKLSAALPIWVSASRGPDDPHDGCQLPPEGLLPPQLSVSARPSFRPLPTGSRVPHSIYHITNAEHADRLPLSCIEMSLLLAAWGLVCAHISAAAWAAQVKGTFRASISARRPQASPPPPKAAGLANALPPVPHAPSSLFEALGTPSADWRPVR